MQVLLLVLSEVYSVVQKPSAGTDGFAGTSAKGITLAQMSDT
jgi:hypothetical protein